VGGALARAVAALRHAHGTLWWLLEDVPLSKGFDAARDDGPDSAGWIVTHLTAYYRFVTVNIGGKPAKISAVHRAAHPTMFDDLPAVQGARRGAARLSRAAMVREHRAGFAALVRAAERLTPEMCATAPAGSMAEYATDRLRCIELATWHEGWHTGQVASIRRRLGLAGKF
jgi:hypothetical protein